jgi:hypothetical protein
MKRYKYMLLAVVILTISCNQKQEQKGDELSGKLTELDELSGEFEPMQTGDFKTYHLAVKGKYENGVWMIDSNAAYMRPGRLPYGTASNGEFQVVYMDANGKVLGKYAIEHPGKSRSCDEGGNKTTIADKFDFEILLPGRDDIKGVSLSQGGKEIQKLAMPARTVRDEISATTPGANDTTRTKR